MPARSQTPIAFSQLGQRSDPPVIARLMAMALETPGLLSLAAGFTDNATLPVDLVGDAWNALSAASAKTNNEFLQYGTNQGRPALRRLLAQRLAHIEAAPALAELDRATLVTNGSQQALYLAMQVLCDPGDIVLVDRPSYFVFLEMLRGLGIEALSLPTDAAGRIDADALGKLLDNLRDTGRARHLKAVYFVSYFSNPSARSLDETEKNAIAQTLAARGLFIPVIEDAAYRELYFEFESGDSRGGWHGLPARDNGTHNQVSTPMPQSHGQNARAAQSGNRELYLENGYNARGILALPAWRDFPKFYTSTLTKPFATGLKTGWGICTDHDWLHKMLHVKGHHDFGSANLNQALLEHAIAAGDYDRQLARLRPAYREKMLALHHALLDAGLPARGWKWRAPEGGLYLWLEAPETLGTGMDSEFCRACIAAGVLYVPGELCFGDAPRKNFIRLSFGVLGAKELTEAGNRFAGVARRF